VNSQNLSIEINHLLFLVLFPDSGKEFPDGPFFTAGYIHDVFGINDYAVWDCLMYNPARLERLLFLRESCRHKKASFK